MRSSEIRSAFLDFFAQKDHLILPSFSLIPQNDPTLLLIGAGMAPLKPYFTGEKTPPHPRVATSQKCVRTPDVELVGLTGRHATFFEMLGNFSFGDYFKEEAIAWSWEFVTERLQLPTSKLWVSIYEEDDEAMQIWRDNIGIPEDRIVRMGKEDNFWEIGTGPCGPCSEIHYDLGPEVGCGSPDCRVDCDCDRYLEIWNLVFTQFNRLPNGELATLERKNIDTGAGLERLAIVMQEASSIYEIDTVRPLMDHIAREYENTNGESLVGSERELSQRIIAEHIRGITFMVGDGVLPANEGRGYVLRRLLRRAVRHGRLLGLEIPFLTAIVPKVISLMNDAYPELAEREEYIKQIVELEENRFRETLNQGLEILENYLQEQETARGGEVEGGVFPGELAFRLYDTYGFPLDLTREILAEKGMEVDEEAFNQALEKQKEQARQAQKTSSGASKEEEERRWEATREISTVFEGYELLETEAQVMAIHPRGLSAVEQSSDTEKQELEILVDRTPFYAESGGQIGDTGVLEGENFKGTVTDTFYNPYEQIVHLVQVEEGVLRRGDKVNCRVDYSRRQAIRRSHTATHILHRVLRNKLGEHVNQSGSLVTPDRLRLDFTHFQAIESEELYEIEATLNELIRGGLSLESFHATLEEAQEMGALALFEAKYGEKVRVIKVNDFSMELCGGTHLTNTGQIGLVRLVREESVAAGVRRIEALTGEEAWKHTLKQEERLQNIAGLLKTSPDRVEEKIHEWMESNRHLQQEYQQLQDRLISYQVESLLNQAQEQEGIMIISSKVDVAHMDALRAMADRLKEKLSSGVIALGASHNGKVILVVAVTADLISEGVHAGNIISKMAEQVGGGGGGRPDMAQAGGKDPSSLPAAMEMVSNLVIEQRQSTGTGQEVN